MHALKTPVRRQDSIPPRQGSPFSPFSPRTANPPIGRRRKVLAYCAAATLAALSVWALSMPSSASLHLLIDSDKAQLQFASRRDIARSAREEEASETAAVPAWERLARWSAPVSKLLPASGPSPETERSDDGSDSSIEAASSPPDAEHVPDGAAKGTWSLRSRGTRRGSNRRSDAQPPAAEKPAPAPREDSGDDSGSAYEPPADAAEGIETPEAPDASEALVPGQFQDETSSRGTAEAANEPDASLQGGALNAAEEKLIDSAVRDREAADVEQAKNHRAEKMRAAAQRKKGRKPKPKTSAKAAAADDRFKWLYRYPDGARGRWADVPEQNLTPKQQKARESHLRYWWPNEKPRTRLYNETAYEDPMGRPEAAAADEPSHYLEYILRDLKPWADLGGISKHDVRNVSILTGGYCAGDMVRFQIMRGRLWVDYRTERGSDGWYPAKLGPGNTSAKGRVPFLIFALLDVLRAFPGQIPDVDAVVHTSDFACMKKDPSIVDYKRPFEITPERPMPILGYNGAPNYFDIPVPDYTYYGHEHSWFMDAADDLVIGWGQQQDYLRGRCDLVPLKDRKPLLIWRGRTHDPEYPKRDLLRRRFVKCPKKLRAMGRDSDAALFDMTTKDVILSSLCDFRYSAYLECEAYTTNLRQKLATGSPLLSPTMQYWEWWSRALVPGKHFVEVSSGDHMCEDIVDKLRAMEAALTLEAEVPDSSQDSTASDSSRSSDNDNRGSDENRGSGDGGGGRNSGGSGNSNSGSSRGNSGSESKSGSSRADGRRGDDRDNAEESQTASSGDLAEGGSRGSGSGSGGGGTGGGGRIDAFNGGSGSGSGSGEKARGQRGEVRQSARSDEGSSIDSQGAASDAVRDEDQQSDLRQRRLLGGASRGEGAAEESASDSQSEMQSDIRSDFAKGGGENGRRGGDGGGRGGGDGTIGNVLASYVADPGGDSAQQIAKADKGRRSRVLGYGSEYTPTQIGENAQQFLWDHVRMEDVRVYWRDLLQQYSKLQTFQPFKSEGARCMNWGRMLVEFGFPFDSENNYDIQLVQKFYPYIQGGDDDIYSCDDEEKTPVWWDCEAVEDWQPFRRDPYLSELCGLPAGWEAQKEWEKNPVGKGYPLPGWDQMEQ
mmetsp:Transcript_524/g.1576  ORF Transcript_524/g.1576 Transcript_524/m.1576 type:complete len:1117 (-) Transcript_524:961-4311(-)